MRLVTTWLKVERTANGVRRIPVNVRSLTGTVNGQEFESSLERDLLLLVHWDNDHKNSYTPPDWNVIHEGEKRHAERLYLEGHDQFTPTEILPLDHGPRAISTPWLNEQEEKALQPEKPAIKHTTSLSNHGPRKTS